MWGPSPWVIPLQGAGCQRAEFWLGMKDHGYGGLCAFLAMRNRIKSSQMTEGICPRKGSSLLGGRIFIGPGGPLAHTWLWHATLSSMGWADEVQDPGEALGTSPEHLPSPCTRSRTVVSRGSLFGDLLLPGEPLFVQLPSG